MTQAAQHTKTLTPSAGLKPFDPAEATPVDNRFPHHDNSRVGVGKRVHERLVIRQAPASAFTRPGIRLAQHHEAGSAFSALPALLNQARALIPHNPQAAYALLEPHTWDYAGSRDFDYLLGVAALESQRPSEAVTALERVLTLYPDDVPARTDIVRAYLMLKERASAEQALRQLVDTAELTTEAQQQVQQYLDILARQNTGETRRWRLGLDIIAGHDDNVNVGSSHARWIIDDGKALNPLPGSQPQASPYLDLAASLSHLYPVTEALEWSSSLQVGHRLNTRQHPQDMGSLSGSTGLAYTLGQHRLSAALNLQQMMLDQHRFRRASGVIGQWQYQRDPATQLGAYSQWFRLDFRNQPFRDANRSVLGTTLARVLSATSGSVLLANPYIGREYTRQSMPTLSFRLAGLRLGYQHHLGPQWRANLGLQWEDSRHRGPDPLFGQTRHDRQLDLRLSLERPLSPQLTLTPQIAYTRNHSTLAPNDFKRLQVSVGVQWRY